MIMYSPGGAKAFIVYELLKGSLSWKYDFLEKKWHTCTLKTNKIYGEPNVSEFWLIVAKKWTLKCLLARRSLTLKHNFCAESIRITRGEYDTALLSLKYQCLHRQALSYLTDHLIQASAAAPRRRRLRSANQNCLTVRRCQLSTYGCRVLHYAGPTVWNSLPDELRNLDSFDNSCDQLIRGFF